MKKRILLPLVVTLMMLCFGEICVMAEEIKPAFFIGDDYVIIEYVKYDLLDNKINYYGVEFELVEGNFVRNSGEGQIDIIPLPVVENRIKDIKTITSINAKIGVFDDVIRGLPSSTVNAPYSKIISAGNWYAETPYVNINIPGRLFFKPLH
ncbi:MAG: hypothetical protein WBO70_02655 [Erysipelotrichaceae bacterium]